MAREVHAVPFGYEPPKEMYKGSLIYYDDFEKITDIQLSKAFQTVKERKFTKFILYPLHEATVKRMTNHPVLPFYKREDRLHEWKREQNDSIITLENWEGKRKKYTPMEAALRHVTEKYKGPFFLMLSSEYANCFASYPFFDEWITKIRLILVDHPKFTHPKLEKNQHRWEVLS
ncbi:hypothetical protein J45TS6_12100 [Paenibacillus sp. J45TS6]|uniref:hypothetical protein n=1 Tax=Paenibacillus sp. J45TS6 TaxID=2807196 RepID=UPI001B1650AF|nr:hypothetical protein [Paenibacillus sp. J45TS6]GIP42751.1 hypothetical protein J45TS6_12100 [Paenibacillus sp. J45TS6]